MKDLGDLVGRSDLFFMAGAITFNVLVAVFPLLLLVAGIAGFVMSARFGTATPELLDFVYRFFPQVGGDMDVVGALAAAVERLISERTGLSVVGALVLLWISTRMVTTIRIVLRTVFELKEDRGIFKGKLFDLQVVLVGGVLLLLNVGLTLTAQAFHAFGVVLLGLGGALSALLQSAMGTGLAFLTGWFLFYLLYRYVPARRVAFRTAAVGATFTAVAHELLKGAFAWYITSLADYSNAYGNMAVVAAIFFWIYYSAVVFIVGGQVARVYELRREARMERNQVRSRSDAGGVALPLLAALLLALPSGASAQSFAPFGGNGNGASGGLLDAGESVVFAASSLERSFTLDRPLVEHDGVYVVVHIAENRVFVMEGSEVVWSAPAGTGNGFHLQGQGREWTFSTPVGMFQVLRKEKNPVWEAPDWHFVQRGQPIPPHNHPSRFIRNTLGTSALFLGDGIAIHGTDRPELLLNPDPEARRVSAGCIRLTNEAARQLYHYVDVGTPVLIY